jgi:hypothetical protein
MSIRDIPNQSALPSSAQYNLRPNAVAGKRTRLSIQPYQSPAGAITSNSLIQFYLPARRGTMLDGQTMYLRGTITGVTTTTAGQARVNRNAFSVFNRLQVYGQDSTLLEDIQEYARLAHILTDSQMSREDKMGLSTIYGSNTLTDESATIFVGTDVEIRAAVADATATAALLNARLQLTTSNLIDRGVVFADANATLNFCIPIISSFGVLSEKLIPLGWLNSDLRIDLYTELPNIAFRSHSAAFAGAEAVTQYSLTNLELVCDVVELQGESLGMVEMMAPPSGPLYLHGTTYKTYSNSLANGTSGFFPILLPHRSLSVKQVLVAGYIATANGFDSFARVIPFGSANLQLGLNIGGSKFPQKPIAVPAEAFAELQKSFHAFNELVQNGSISRTEYTRFAADNSSILNALSCKPVIGFDTELFQKRSGLMLAGQNWTGLNCFLEGFVARNAAGNALAAALTVHSHVNFDVVYVIQDGIISVRF